MARRPLRSSSKPTRTGSNYEAVTIDMGGNACPIAMLFWVAIRATSSLRVSRLRERTLPATRGGCFDLAGSPRWLQPAHHVTVRHVLAHTNGVPGTYQGAFTVPGPSHEIAFQYVTGRQGGSGLILGVEHTTDKTRLPYNIFIHTSLFHDNHLHGGSQGALYAGVRNSATYRTVSYNNSDGGFNGQGPHMDNNTFWDVVAFGQGSLGLTSGGNQRGHPDRHDCPYLSRQSSRLASGAREPSLSVHCLRQ